MAAQDFAEFYHLQLGALVAKLVSNAPGLAICSEECSRYFSVVPSG